MDPESSTGLRIGVFLLMAVSFALMIGLSLLAWIHQRKRAHEESQAVEIPVLDQPLHQD